jgi:multiple antibiotic resistance protein
MNYVEEIRRFAEATISVFAIVNPIGNLPVFVGLIEHLSPPERKRVLRIAGLTALAIICTMALIGQYLLEGVFHISMSEFMFGGGLILIAVGIRGILTRQAVRHDPGQSAAVDSVRLAVSPMASPLLVGPGSIVTVMLLVSRHSLIYGLAACLVAFVFVILVLNFADVAYRLMGRVGALAVGRIMEIFIVAIGASFVFRAMKEVFPVLAGK